MFAIVLHLAHAACVSSSPTQSAGVIEEALLDMVELADLDQEPDNGSARRFGWQGVK